MIFGTHDANTLEQLAGVAEKAERVALMADGHFGYIMPVGGVAAYRNAVSVAGVGFDIACGNCAIRTDLAIDDLPDIPALADAIASEVSFGIGRKNKSDDAPSSHHLFADGRWSVLAPNVLDSLRDKAREQLGTVGSGNHYVDVFVDTFGRVWVGVHFGSRGLGHTIASGFLALSAGEQWGARVKEHDALLSLDSLIGADYWALMSLAGEYAYAGREWVCRKVVSLLGGSEVEMIHNHHNFAWKEQHFGEDYVVVRKGATPAFPGQMGFVGGSMGDDSVILRGARTDASSPDRLEQEGALFSTVHGAGRVMSRSEAAGKIKRRKAWRCGQRDCAGELPIKTERAPDGSNPKCPICGGKTHKREVREITQAGRITQEMMSEWIGMRGVTLRGGGLDESPHVYRRLPDVLDAQGGTIEILETLTPIIVVMAGADEYDPYKD